MTVNNVCGRSYALVKTLIWTLALLLLRMLSFFLLFAESHADSQSWKTSTLPESRVFIFKHFGGHFVVRPSHAQGTM